MRIQDHFLKLFFFRRFFFSPKRKSGMVPILLSLFLLTGCLPTPEVEPVIHKNEGTLEQQISATAAPAYQITIDAEGQKETAASATETVEATAAPKENTLREAVGAPERVQDSFDGPAVGAQLYIEMDAAVEVPNVEKVPVLRGRVGYAPEQAAERITKLLLGDGPYVRPGHSERAYNQLFMEYYQKWIEALDQKPYGPGADYDRIQQNLQQNFDAHAEGFRNADTSYDRPSQPWTGSFDDAIQNGISISNGERSVGMVAGNTHFSYSAGSHPSLYGWMDCPRGPRDEEEERDLQNAADFANALGCAQVIPQYIIDADEDTRVRNQVETGFDSGYKHFTLLPVYEGIPVYPYTTMYGSDTGRQAAGIPFARNLEQEEIFGTLYEGEVISLQWNSPFTVLSVENENVPLLSFERIMEIFRRQVFMSVYCDQGHPITYRITGIQFSYMRVQVKDSDDYYLLPVWDFTGYMIYDWQMSPGDMAVARGFFHSMSILTINAVDGSILDRYLGY